MNEFVLIPTKSQIRLNTFAEGLLSKFAHDLELRCIGLSGTATREQGEQASPGVAGTATISVPLSGIEVTGTVHGTRINFEGLSAKDRRDCLEKMRHDVFHTDESGVIRIEVTLRDGNAQVRIVPPKGKTVELSTQVNVHEESGTVIGKGTLELSLMAIGSDVVKGPMNSFRVKDRVVLHFDVAFAPK
ncbi:MAG: hypothetical protein FWD73_11390 [Polyangiaceae bacterium]|nr:hypothetical protein [Polyangiaceae bacterium]